MERKRMGRLLAAFAVALVATLGFVLGLGSTAYAKEYTTLSVGDVLHVGDTINSTTSYFPSSAETSLGTHDRPWTLVRCDVDTSKPGTEGVVESDSGLYYSFKDSSNNYAIYSTSSGVGGIVYAATATSDGIYVKEFGEAEDNDAQVTFAVHETVKYLDANGEEQTCTEYTTITNATTGELTGWCVVSGKVTITSPMYFNGDTHIILCDGAELTVNGLKARAETGAHSLLNLTIYAQSTGDSMGKLVAKNDGIITGTSTLTINGGVIEAEGAPDGIYSDAEVIINGGKVTCTGINYGILANSVKINGGTVTTAGINNRCIRAYGAYGEEDPLTIAKGITVIEGNDEASAQPVADPSTWKPSKKWARTMPSVPVESVELDQATATLEPGKTVTLNATVKPDDATDKSVTWTSSDEKVATVEDGVVTAVAPGEATITATSVDNPEATAACAVTVKAAPGPEPKPVEGQDMFRLYNPYSGEHFYTASAYERDSLVGLGWHGEGVGWVAPAEGVPVYRLYNPYAGDHHYTVSAFERDHLVELGWTDEGVGWHSAGENGVPVYRQYNPYASAGTHNYTTSEHEAMALVELGWLYEGIGWYGL